MSKESCRVMLYVFHIGCSKHKRIMLNLFVLGYISENGSITKLVREQYLLYYFSSD